MKKKILECARGACDAAAHPAGYNRVTHMLYCIRCARRINERSLNEPDGEFFPLLKHVREVKRGGTYRKGVILLKEGAG
jgi:hypothetical protein